MLWLSSADFFQNQLSQQFISVTHIKGSNGLDPDQGRHSVGLGLGSNCLQTLSADNKSRHYQEKS